MLLIAKRRLSARCMEVDLTRVHWERKQSKDLFCDVVAANRWRSCLPRIRHAGLLCVVVACVVASTCGTAWTAPLGPRGVVTVGKAALDASEPDGVYIGPSSIRFRIGDDSSWKDPGFNDADWNVTDGVKYPVSGLDARPPFRPIWFRFDLHLDTDLVGKPLVLKSKGTTESPQVFLNGNREADVQNADPTTGVVPRCIVPLQTDYVVALRWIPNTDRLIEAMRSKEPLSLALFLEDYNRLLRNWERQDHNDRTLALHRIILIAVFAVFFLFHLALYAHYPRRRENIYYGMTALFCALALGSLHVSEVYRYDHAIWGFSYIRCFFAFMPLSLISGFGLFQLLLIGRIRWTMFAYTAVGFACYVAGQWVGSVPVHWFPLIVIPELVWGAWSRYRRSGLPFGWSTVVALVIASVVLSAAGSLNHWHLDSGFLRYAAWYFFLAFLQVVAIAFAREYANDKKRIQAFAASLEDEVATRTRELNEEVTVRRKAEKELKAYHDTLEDLVRLRTRELETKSSRLQEEIDERKRTEDALQSVSRRLADVRDEERRRMARDLHDSVAQELAGIVMNLGLIEDSLPRARPEVKQLLATTLSAGEKCSQEVRTLSYLLHPPLLDQLGLIPALRSYVGGFAKRSGIEVAVEVEPDFARLPAEIELTLFRIMQECLGNIHRHAHSNTAYITLGRDSDSILLEVRDEGRGIPLDTLAAIRQSSSHGGVGIAGMQERLRLLNGVFSLESSTSGTTIRVTIPLGGTGD